MKHIIVIVESSLHSMMVDTVIFKNKKLEAFFVTRVKNYYFYLLELGIITIELNNECYTFENIVNKSGLIITEDELVAFFKIFASVIYDVENKKKIGSRYYGGFKNYPKPICEVLLTVSRFNNDVDYGKIRKYDVDIIMLSLYLSKKYDSYLSEVSLVDYYAWCVKHRIKDIPTDAVDYVTVNYPEKLI